jgi:putative ABC transport system permease protein
MNAAPALLRLAVRNVLRQRARSAVTLAAIIVGVAALVLSSGFIADIFIQLGEAMIRSQFGHVQVSRRGFHEMGARAPEKYLIDDPASLRQILAAQAGVDDVLARISFSGLANNGRADVPIIGEGVEPDRERRLGTYVRIVAGRSPTDADRHGALLGAGVARALGVAPGDPLTLVVSTAGGAMNTLDVEVVGVFQSFSKDFDARAVRIGLEAAQTLLDTNSVNTLVLSLHSTTGTRAAAEALRQRLDAGQFEVKAWYELSDFYEKTVDLYGRQFGVLRLIILFMVLLSVSSSVNMTVMERLGEFGTMRALGNRGRMTFGLIAVEGLVLGVAGSLAGAALGVLLAVLISAIGIPMPPPPNSDLGYTARIQIVPSEVVLAMAVGAIATVLGAMLPARRVLRTPIVDALRQNA